MSHTPGPWTVIPPEESYHKPLVKRGMEGGFAVSGLSRERELADARLIAAAPDLLAVAELALPMVRHLGSKEQHVQAKAAIKKARGQ